MKKIIKLLILVVFVLPFIVRADTYSNEVKKANNLLNEEFYINTYEKYILIGKKVKYEYSDGKMKYNSLFKTGGFLSKDEYELTQVRGLSYLLTEPSYWTLSKNKKNVYVITTDNIDEAKDVKSNYRARVTEYVKPKAVVRGSGTQNDPWQFDPMYKVSAYIDESYATIVSGNNEYVKGNCSTSECTAEIKIVGKSGYRYISNDCDGTYNAETKTLSVSNVRRNLECNVEFGYGLFSINLTDATPNTFYAIYGENYYSDIDSKTVLKSLSNVAEKKGYTFTGFSYDGLEIVDKNKNLNKNSLNNITKDLSLKPSYEPNKYTVSYDCNGGTEPPESQSVTFDGGYVLTDGFCKREGYIQVGWNESPDGKGVTWTKENRSDWVWNIDNNVTLYASWKPCSAGTYAGASDNTCNVCPEGTYSSQTAGRCLACPEGYTSKPGADNINKCYITLKAGTHLPLANSNKPAECPNGDYMEEHTVNYGNYSNCVVCPAGYTDGDKLEDKTSLNKCVRKVAAGYYVAAPKAKGNTVCENGYFKETHTIRYGETSSCDICPTGYRDGSKLDNKVSQNKCLRNVTAGYYIASSKSINNTLCPNGEYSTTHSILYGETSKCTACPEGYRDGRKLDNKISKDSCLKNVPAGSYLASEKSEESKVCPNGFYNEAHSLKYGETSRCVACPEGYRDGATVSNKTAKDKCLRNVSGGYYVASAKATVNTECLDGYYKDKHGVTYGSTSSCSQCPEGYRDGKSILSKSSKTSCTRIVDAGYYLASANDTKNTLCENGKYKGTHNVTYGQTSVCNNCPDGYRDGTSFSSKTAENRCVRNVPAGYYIVGRKATNDTECPDGYYKQAHSVNYGSVSRCTVCPSGYRNGTSVSNKTSINSCIRNVPKNYYISEIGDDKNTACPKGTIKNAHTVKYGNTSSCTPN